MLRRSPCSSVPTVELTTASLMAPPLWFGRTARGAAFRAARTLGRRRWRWQVALPACILPASTAMEAWQRGLRPLIRDARLPEAGREGPTVHIGVSGGRFAAMAPHLAAEAGEVVEAGGRLVSQASSKRTSTSTRPASSRARFATSPPRARKPEGGGGQFAGCTGEVSRNSGLASATEVTTSYRGSVRRPVATSLARSSEQVRCWQDTHVAGKSSPRRSPGGYTGPVNARAATAGAGGAHRGK